MTKKQKSSLKLVTVSTALVLIISSLSILAWAQTQGENPTSQVNLDASPSIDPKQQRLAQLDQILTQTWDSYKQHFIIQDRVIDPQQNNLTTSEGMSYGLLQAVYLQDQATFDRLLDWTNNHLKDQNNLFAWKWQDGKVTDPAYAADADQDIALALILAHQTWQNPTYLTQAQEVLSALWQYQVVSYAENYYLIAGNWANKSHELVLNPSYLSPASYRIFAQIDPAHPWLNLVDTSYTILEACTTSPLNSTIPGALPPEWCALDKKTNQFRASTDPVGDEYSFNAVRVPIRIATDYFYSQDPRSHSYLQCFQLFATDWQSSNIIYPIYSHQGQPLQTYDALLPHTAALPYFLVTQPAMAEQLFDSKILPKLITMDNKTYWEDPQNYYTQNITWFALAFYKSYLSSANHM